MMPKPERAASPIAGAGCEAFVRAVFDDAAEAIVVVAADGVIEAVNRSAERTFGVTSSEVLGRRADMLSVPAERRRQNDPIVGTPSLAGHCVVSPWESVGLRKDGTRFPMEVSVTSFDVDGRAYAVWFVRDVTARVQLEAQLRQSQKMETLGQLVGGVSHDVNNLLTVINGWCEELSDLPREAVTRIADAAAQAARLTGQLLAFSREAAAAPTVVDLNGVVADVNRMLRRVLGEDVRIEEVLERPSATVRLDPGQLGQVLVNLALNARDAMPRGGRLRIETRSVRLDEADAERRHVAPGRFVQLSVSDTGTGISAEALPRVFEPFFTTKAPGRGTGLGLATVNGIVRRADGAIWVESHQGRGTTFTVVLPEVAATRRDGASIATPMPDRGSETVLVVEDDPQVRRIIVSMLQSRGYRVLASDDERQALATAASEPLIDLLVSDVVLPELSGPVVAERVRLAHPSMSVLFVSGYTADAVAGRGVTDRNAEFLQKPFTGHQLGRRVREVLDRRDAPRDGARAVLTGDASVPMSAALESPCSVVRP